MNNSHEEDDCEVTTFSYKKLFKIKTKLIKEYDKIEKRHLDIKDYIEFLENNNEMLRYEMTNFKNQANKCETCVSMKKEVKFFHETLSNFTKGK